MLRISTGEDWLTNIAIGKNVRKILCVEDVVYNYYINSNSMMQQQVCSFGYADRVKDILELLTADASDHIKHLVKCNRIAAYINCLFVPELPFSWKHYKSVRKELKLANNESDVEKIMDNKFLRFIYIPLFYFLYSRLYCFLFKCIKLKLHKRKVLK